MEAYEIAVIGAGISGLSMAHLFSKRGMRVLVLEKEKRAGGSLHSHRHGDFWAELGAHTCYNSYGTLLKIFDETDLRNGMCPRTKLPYRFYTRGKIRSLFTQVRMAELLVHVPLLFFVRKKGKSVATYYSRIVGRKNYEKVFGPAFNAVICQKADEFPVELLFKKRARQKDVLRSFTQKNGLGTIVERLAKSPLIDLQIGTEALSIEKEGDRFVIHTQGRKFFAKVVALATPPNIASEILKKQFPALATHLTEIQVKKTESMAVILKAKDLKLKPLAGLIPERDSFFSVVSRDVVSHPELRGFTFHFKKGYSRAEKIDRISKILNVAPEHFLSIGEQENRIPAVKVGHQAWVRKLDDLLKKEESSGRLLLTGNYFSGLAIEECVSRSAQEVGRFTSSHVHSEHGRSS